MKTVLFLDIDGVLNPVDNNSSLKVMWQNGIQPSKDKFGYLFDERCVRWLRYIVFKTNCDIVISSDWKDKGFDFLKEMWAFREMPGNLIGITPFVIDADTMTIENDNGNLMGRGHEIHQWLKNCLLDKIQIYDRFCILDDKNDFLERQKLFVVKTDQQWGLSFLDASHVIDVLHSFYLIQNAEILQKGTYARCNELKIVLESKGVDNLKII